MKVYAQGDCVAYEVAHPADACQLYRRDMTNAKIAIVTKEPDGRRVHQLLEALRDVAAFASAHHGDQPAHVLLHGLTVDIPDMIGKAFAGERA